jgi:parallel beta-helix repeat protein
MSPRTTVYRTRLIRSLSLAFLLGAPAMTGCGDSEGSVKADDEPDAGGDIDNIDNTRFDGCTQTIAEGSDTEVIQTALIEAKTGDTLCFEDGTYAIKSELSLTVNDVTLRGNPKDRAAVVLDYSAQDQGKDGLNVNSAGFTIEHLSLKNTHGNSIVVKGSDRVTFRNLKVSWDQDASSDNGAYAVYPLSSSNVLVEDCEVVGARDAGIYVGQSKNIIVRNNVVHGNVAGIEIENSDDALVTDNHVYDNSGGILVFVLPNLEKKSGGGVIVANNLIESNNHANFGEAGTTVSYVPAGTGILVLAADTTEIRNNEIHDNDTTGVLALSYQTFSTICMVSGGSNCASNDTKTDADLSKLYIHDNTFANNGTKPDTLVETLLGAQVENVLWDGRKPAAELDQDQLCLGDEATSVRTFGGQQGIEFDTSKQSTDGSSYVCSLPSPFSAIELTQES